VVLIEGNKISGVGYAIMVDEVFKCPRKIIIRLHGIYSSREDTSTSTKELEHIGSTMSHDTIIKGAVPKKNVSVATP
jgi:hypothetical protein